MSAHHDNLMQHMYIHIVLALAMCVWHETLRKAPHPRLAGEYTAERRPLSTVQFEDEGSTN